MNKAGFVLVGGQSRRMGRNKALLPWHSGTLVEYVAGEVERAAGTVALIGNEEQRVTTRFPYFLDRRPGYGPISGVHAALLSGRGAFNLVLPCDMPQIASDSLLQLFETAEASASGCSVAEDEQGRIHPLCAVYPASALRQVEEAMDGMRLRLTELVQQLGAVRVPWVGAVTNCNTPEEWAALQS